MKRDYPRLDIYEFGEHLLQSGDLDPVYIALNRMEWGQHEQLGRWLVAYWAFYHCGVASYLSEFDGESFWDAMTEAAINTTPAPDGGRWPRGSERRHFRGQQALTAIAAWGNAYGENPHEMVGWIAGPTDGHTPMPFVDVASRASAHRAFGPWISFKVADMLDRLGIVPVDFDQSAVFMFDTPVKAALMLWRQKQGLPDHAKPLDQPAAINTVVEHLTDHFKGHTAPPLHERPVGLQEIETILCKWKSHLSGHYPLYNDIDEIREGLASWAPHSETARAMLHAMPNPEGSDA